MNEKKGLLGRISSLSIDRYRIVYLGMVLLVLLGVYFYQILPRESKPEVVFPRIKINTNYPGASPADVESLITNKLEAVFSGIDEIEFMTSSSLAGRSEIQLDFYPGVNIDDKINEVNQAVISVKDLPDESKIIIHGNKTRQIEFISDKEAISSSYFSELGVEELYSKLTESGVTHLASTCYKNPWNKGVLKELESQSKLVSVFSDECSILYRVIR